MLPYAAAKGRWPGAGEEFMLQGVTFVAMARLRITEWENDRIESLAGVYRQIPDLCRRRAEQVSR